MKQRIVQILKKAGIEEPFAAKNIHPLKDGPLTMTFTRSNPSDRYTELLQLYKQVHEDGIPEQNLSAEDAFAGQSLHSHITNVAMLCRKHNVKSILDYGSGKGSRYLMNDLELSDGSKIGSVKEYWGGAEITCFDPAYKKYSKLPKKVFDGVVCTDVLEHIPEADVQWVLNEIIGFADKFVFANTAYYPAQKVLPNGENAHCTVKPPEWWKEKVAIAVKETGFNGELCFTVREKNAKQKFPQKLWRRRRVIDHVIDLNSN